MSILPQFQYIKQLVLLLELIIYLEIIKAEEDYKNLPLLISLCIAKIYGLLFS